MALMPKLVEPDATIARYYSAYMLANPGSDRMPSLIYERGWFVMRDGASRCRHRRKTIEEMIQRLIHRSASITSGKRVTEEV